MRPFITVVLLCACAAGQLQTTELSVAFVQKSRYRTDISKQAVWVKEDGVSQRVLNLESAANQPRCIALLIDNSASSGKSGFTRDRTRLLEPINASLDWLRQTLPGGRHRAMVVNFNMDYYLDQRLTDSIPLITAAMQKVDVRGATALYDAIIAASLDLAKDATPDCRKVMVAMTDATDNASKSSQGEAVGAARRAGVTLYIIGLRDRHPMDLTRKLAETTGGAYFSAANRGDLRSAFASLEQDLNSRYRLTYLSSSPRNVRVPISVAVSVKKVAVLAPQFREVWK